MGQFERNNEMKFRRWNMILFANDTNNISIRIIFTIFRFFFSLYSKFTRGKINGYD